MKIKKLTSLLTGVLIAGAIFSPQMVSAGNEYPTHTETTDVNGITMTNTVSWNDVTHTDGNYNANLDITINGLQEKNTFNEPIDVQIVHDISTSMDEVCWNPAHVNFHYYKKAGEALTAEQLAELRIMLKDEIEDRLTDKKALGKDDWISFAGKTDKEGNVFSENAYLVPSGSVTYGNGAGNDETVIYPTDYETRFYIIDNPVVSMNDTGLGSGSAYYALNYHAGIDEQGAYHSLSTVPDKTTNEWIHFGFFNRETAIKRNCKSYTTTAYKLMLNFGTTLYDASLESHFSMTSFSEIERYTSLFTDNSNQFGNDIITAFNQMAGQTNYEAGLVAGAGSLKNHDDKDGRKKYIIFISDGRPNRSLDDEGNVVPGDNMLRLSQIADQVKADGTEIYTVGFCIDKWTNDNYLLPIATDEDHSHFRTPDQLDQMVEIYDLIQERVIEDTYIKSTVENTISKYYTVDKENLPADVILTEEEQTSADGTTRMTQKIRYRVKTEDLDPNGINTKTIPLILKEEYRTTNDYYPTNDEALNGANAVYENLDAAKETIAVETPWLSVNVKEEQTYQIDTEVENGTISENITGIKSGETKEITYAPNDGYTLMSIEVDGQTIDMEQFKEAYTFENINENHTIKVIYQKQNSEKPEHPNTPDTSDKPNTPNTPANGSSGMQSNNSIQTGDDTNLPFYIAATFIAIIGIVFAAVKKGRNMNK